MNRVIAALVGLAVILGLLTFWYWRRTRPVEPALVGLADMGTRRWRRQHEQIDRFEDVPGSPEDGPAPEPAKAEPAKGVPAKGVPAKGVPGTAEPAKAVVAGEPIVLVPDDPGAGAPRVDQPSR